MRNNIIMGCNNGGSSAGIIVGSDRDSRITHNTVYDAEPRNAGFYEGHPVHTTLWRHSILENGVNINYANQALDEADNVMPSHAEMDMIFTAPVIGDFSACQRSEHCRTGAGRPGGAPRLLRLSPRGHRRPWRRRVLHHRLWDALRGCHPADVRPRPVAAWGTGNPNRGSFPEPEPRVVSAGEPEPRVVSAGVARRNPNRGSFRRG